MYTEWTDTLVIVTNKDTSNVTNEVTSIVINIKANVKYIIIYIDRFGIHRKSNKSQSGRTFLTNLARPAPPVATGHFHPVA